QKSVRRALGRFKQAGQAPPQIGGPAHVWRLAGSCKQVHARCGGKLPNPLREIGRTGVETESWRDLHSNQKPISPIRSTLARCAIAAVRLYWVRASRPPNTCGRVSSRQPLQRKDSS